MAHRSDEEIRVQVQYRLTEELVAAKERYRCFAENVGDIVFGCNDTWELTYVNSAWTEVLGYRSDESVGRSVTDFLGSDGLNSDISLSSEQRHEVSMLCADGTLRWFELSFWPTVPDGLIGLLHDTTERKRANRELQESQRKLAEANEQLARVKLAVDASSDAIGISTADGLHFYQNETFTRMFGYGVEEFGDKLHPASLYADPEVARDAFATIMDGGSCEREIEMVAKDGRCFPVHLRADAIKNEEGVVIGLIGIHRDVTERKQAEMQLDQHVAALESMNRALAVSNERAEAATRAKSDFLANVSHEIRTPITAIMGFADLLSDPEGRSPKDAAWAQRILQNANHLRRLLDDILDLTKIEAGRMKIECETCDLTQIIDDVAAAFREDANAKRLGFGIQYGAGAPKLVVGDRTRIMQVLVNLVSNAVKFTSQGNVTINTSMVPADDERCDPPEVRIAVTDTGMGMSGDQLQELFAPFQQLHNPDLCGAGTGLGLAISDRLVGLMGGRIEVESEPEKGTRFTVVLRGERTTELPSQPEPRVLPLEATSRVAFPGLRVLLVEDNVDNEEVFVHMLQPTGVQLTLARNGVEAIEEVAQRRASGLGFDLILMDMQMPVKNGFETTAELRRSGIGVPIIAVTAYAMEHQRRQCLDAGCDACLPKPVVRQDLYTAMAQAIDSYAIAQEAADLVTPLSATGSCQGGNATFVEILARYVASLRQHLKAIHAAESAGDAEEICKIAHRLKGTAANYGFPEITETAGLCHDRLHEGAHLVEIEQPLRRLKQQVLDAVDTHPREDPQRTSNTHIA